VSPKGETTTYPNPTKKKLWIKQRGRLASFSVGAEGLAVSPKGETTTYPNPTKKKLWIKQRGRLASFSVGAEGLEPTTSCV
jgi:ribosomal protein L28